MAPDLADMEELAWWWEEHNGQLHGHESELHIRSLRNLGWQITLISNDKDFDFTVYLPEDINETEESWLHFEAKGNMVHIRCGPFDLPRAIDAIKKLGDIYAEYATNRTG